MNDKESIEVYIYFIVDELVSWCFKRQIVIALSSCEFEYYALFEANKEAIWLRRLLIETNQISIESSLIWVDNQDAIVVIENFEFHRRMKHVDIKYHWVKQIIEDELIQVKYISTTLMIVDELTKSLRSQKFNKFLILINMID